jgi:hypothetical protein
MLKWTVLPVTCRRARELFTVLITLDTLEMALVSLQINDNIFIRFLPIPPETKLVYVLGYTSITLDVTL